MAILVTRGRPVVLVHFVRVEAGSVGSFREGRGR